MNNFHRIEKIDDVTERVCAALIAHQLKEIDWKRLRYFDRHRQVLILLLAQPGIPPTSATDLVDLIMRREFMQPDSRSTSSRSSVASRDSK
jgi:hypothetical protein